MTKKKATKKKMPKKKATKKKPCCPTCGGETAPHVFELPEEYSYAVFALRDGVWDFVDNVDSEDEAVELAEYPSDFGEWVVVYSYRTGKVVWGPGWVPGEGE